MLPSPSPISFDLGSLSLKCFVVISQSVRVDEENLKLNLIDL